jgi:hypothetical protein
MALELLGESIPSGEYPAAAVEDNFEAVTRLPIGWAMPAALAC